MPRAKTQINNGKEKIYYYRKNPDDYGKSKIFIEPISQDDEIFYRDNKIKLPVLDICKYYPNARIYSFIEEYDKQNITMIDVLYTYDDILTMLEENDDFLEVFLDECNRKELNFVSTKFPGLTYMPRDNKERANFQEALKRAFLEKLQGGEYALIQDTVTEEREVINEKYDYKNAKQDSITMMFIKTLYEATTGIKVRRKNEPKMKKVTTQYEKKAYIIKMGCSVIDKSVVGKYFIAYNLSSNMEQVTDKLAIYLENLDDDVLLNDERLKRFGKVLFNSTIIETFLSLYINDKSRIMFAGKYNSKSKRIEMSTKTKEKLESINNMLNYKDSGR